MHAGDTLTMASIMFVKEPSEYLHVIRSQANYFQHHTVAEVPWGANKGKDEIRTGPHAPRHPSLKRVEAHFHHSMLHGQHRAAAWELDTPAPARRRRKVPNLAGSAP